MSNPTKFVFNPLSSNFDIITNTDAEGLTFNAPIISSTLPAIPVTGQMWMNSSLNVKVPGGTLQVGEEMYMNVINKTGSILPNGSFIYISGVDSGYPKAILAQANSLISHQTMALTTNAIAIDAVSNVTTVGLVHDLKTDVDSEGHAVTAGDKIWLSKSVPGGWTNVEPYAPDYSIILGTVTVVSATVGEILVDIEINNARDLAIISQEPTGFDVPANVGIAYDSTTQKVTVSGANWKAYWRGKEVLEIPTGVIPVAHDNVLDHTYFLYWDGTGINNGFNWSTDSFSGFDKVLIAYVYYYTGNIFCNRECHGLMDWRAHQEFHENVGAYLFSGGQLTAGTYVLNPTAGTHTTAQNTYGTEIAVIKDEDLPTTIPAWIEGTYTTAYRLGAAGDWVFSTVATVPYHFNGGTNFIQYNQLTGGAWQLTDVTEDNYYNTFIFYVPTASDVGSQKYREIVVADQGISTTLAGALARTTLNLDVGNLKNILVESMPYIRITWLKNSSGGGAYPAGVVGRCAILNITYNSGSSKSLILASGLTPGDHSSLSGRTDLNSHPISAIDSATLGSVIFSSATGLAEDNANLFFNDTLNMLTAPIMGPKADGTSAIKVTKADGLTSLMTVDTTNSVVRFPKANLLLTRSNAVSLENNTASDVVNTIQRSPVLNFLGNTWDSDDAINRTSEFGIINEPLSGTAATGILTFTHSLDGAASSTVATISSSGSFAIYSNVIINNTGISNTSQSGFISRANTAASATTLVRYSPRSLWVGRAWNTTPTAASNTITFSVECMPVSGATTSGSLVYTYDNNGGGYSEIARLTYDGKWALGLTAPTNKIHVDSGTGTASYSQFTAGTTTGQTSTDGLLVGIDATGKQ
jgi:hypothetical protein